MRNTDTQKTAQRSYIAAGALFIIVMIYGIWWTGFTSRFENAPAIMGLLFIGIAVAVSIYCFKKAAEIGVKRREEEEQIRKMERAARTAKNKADEKKTAAKFCPQCGEPLNGYFDICIFCGKKLK